MNFYPHELITRLITNASNEPWLPNNEELQANPDQKTEAWLAAK